MDRFPARFALIVAALVHFSSAAFAAPLDDYYLQQFGEATTTQLQKAVLSVTTAKQEPPKCGMPLKKSLLRDWDLLEASTQKVLAKQLAAPTLGDNNSDSLYSSQRFNIHYATQVLTTTDSQGITIIIDNRPPATDANANGVPDWVETVAQTFENVASSYSALEWKLAPTINGARYDVYLRDLAPLNYYGVTTSGVSAASASYPYAVSSWMELDNNYTDSLYLPYNPLQSLQITAAHEYHHAIQYGYNYYFDVWYAEATSSWLEDELYDGVNQLYNYIPGWFNNSTKPLDLAVGADAVTVGAGYGRWIFNRYLSEAHGPAMIRSAWEKLAPLPSPGGGADIPMIPVLDSLLTSTYASSLRSDFFGFTKRVYQRDWTHIDDIDLIHPYTPLASYSISTLPVNAYTLPAPTVTLPHYSFAYYRFVPASGAPSNLPISLTSTSGIMATAFRKNGTTITEFPFTSFTVSVPGFNTSTEVVLLVANTTDVNNHQANFSTDGTGLPVSEPTGGSLYPPLQPSTPSISGGSSGGGGCFIATAAYGSYLHPQVQLLRDFRDHYLLTNAPGRAFVALYYRCSPPLADFIARQPFLRGVTRLALAPLVMVVVHPEASGAALLLAVVVLHRPLRRRLKCQKASKMYCPPIN
ncbi:MAG: MXAN_6640 family putative metalloprotease [Desulfuromonadaceae bacterium]